MSRAVALLAAAGFLLAACGGDVMDDGRLLESAVRIEALGCQPLQLGTGVVVDDELVLTAAHVVAGSEQVTVTAGSTVLDAVPVLIDVDLDIALLRVRELAAAPVGLASRRVRTTSALALPDGLTEAPLIRTVWALTTDIHRDHEVTKLVLELDIDARSGDSGGAVLDGAGRVAGILVSRAPELGVSFAVHVEEIAPLLDHVPDERAPRGSCSR